MVNTKAFVQRIEKICEEHDLTSTAFAEKVEVGRATISHISSGRNKPSLDFVLKVVSAFPDVDLQWLLNGKGTFPKKETPTQSERPALKETLKKSPPSVSQNTPSFEKNIPVPFSKGNIKRVVIFFEDGTFESYES